MHRASVLILPHTLFFSLFSDMYIKLVTTNLDMHVRQLHGHEGTVLHVAFSVDGDLLVSVWMVKSFVLYF